MADNGDLARYLGATQPAGATHTLSCDRRRAGCALAATRGGTSWGPTRRPACADRANATARKTAKGRVSRETVAAKAVRYLAEGRLVITSVMGDYVTATCRGDGEIYELGHASAWWWCSCPAPAGRCCHLTALRLVTVRRRTAAAEVHQDTRRLPTRSERL